MKKFTPITSLLWLTILPLTYLCQDVEFSQYFTSKNYLNSAFTATTSDQSFSTVYRNQWPGIKNAYNSYFISYDRRIQQKNAGYGIYYIEDVAGEGALRNQSIAIQYAKHFRLAKNLHGSFGVKGSFNNRSIKWDRLVWGDMLDARRGVVYNTQQERGRVSEIFFNSGAGFLLYSNSMYGGIAVENLNRPNQSFLSFYQTSKIPLRYKYHLGGDIPLRIVPNALKIIISPQVIITHQREARQINLGSYLTYGSITIGMWHRIKDSFIILAGVEHKRYRFKYSYDISANNLISHSGGAHEISITYQMDFLKGKKQKKFKTLSCPVF